jgi:hypothetical protein
MELDPERPLDCLLFGQAQDFDPFGAQDAGRRQLRILGRDGQPERPAEDEVGNVALVRQQQIQVVGAGLEVDDRLHLALAEVDVLLGEGQRLLEIQWQWLIDEQVVMASTAGCLAGRDNPPHGQTKSQHKRRDPAVPVLEVAEIGLWLAVRWRFDPGMAQQFRRFGCNRLRGDPARASTEDAKEKDGQEGEQCTHGVFW